MSNMQRIHQPTHIFIMPLPPLKTNFFEVKICEADLQECMWQQAPTPHKVSCIWKSRSHAGDDQGVCACPCVTMGPRQQWLGHPAQDTRVPATLLTCLTSPLRCSHFYYSVSDSFTAFAVDEWFL